VTEQASSRVTKWDCSVGASGPSRERETESKKLSRSDHRDAGDDAHVCPAGALRWGLARC